MRLVMSPVVFSISSISLTFAHNEPLDGFDAACGVGVEDRNEYLRERLADFDVHLAAQGQYHRRNLLGHGHHLLQFTVDERGVADGEGRKMHRLVRVAAAYGVQIAEDTVGDERRERCGEHRNGFQTGVERLVGRQFVACPTAAPETFAVEAHVPIR